MKNLRPLREAKKITQLQLANILGTDRTSIGKWERHGVLPSKDVICKIADFFNVSIDYLFDREDSSANILLSRSEENLIKLYRNANRQAKDTALIILDRGQKAAYLEQSSQEISKELTSLDKGISSSVSIPVVGRAAAGLPIEMIVDYGDLLAVNGADVRYGDFAVIADGDSMVNVGIHHGDRVIIRPQPSVENGQIALVAIENGSTIKRFYKEARGYRLVSENPKFPDQRLPISADIRVLGKFIKTV